MSIAKILNILIGEETNEMSDLKQHLTRGAAGSFLLQVSFLLLIFLNHVLLANILGARQYGIYAFAFSIVEVGLVLTVLGCPQLLTREIPAIRTGKKRGTVKEIIRFSNALSGGVSVFIAGLIAAGTSFFYGQGWMKPNVYYSLLVASLLLPVLSAIRLHAGILNGLKHVVLAQLPVKLLHPGLLLLLVLLGFFIFELPALALHAITIEIIAVFTVSLISGGLAWYFIQSKPFDQCEKRRDNPVGNWLASALYLMLVSGLGILNRRIDIIMLGLMSSPEGAGVYNAAARSSALVVVFIVAINGVLSPTISELYNKGAFKRLQNILKRSMRVATVGAIPLVVFFLVAGSWYLGIFFGGEFQKGYPVLAFLSLIRLSTVIVGPVGTVMVMTDFERMNALIIGVALGINIVLNILLIPFYGIFGAAIANGTGLLLLNGIQFFWIIRSIGIDPSIMDMEIRN